MKKLIFLTLSVPYLSFGLTLNEAVEYAVKNNRELSAHREDIKISKLQIKIDKNLYYPSFFANISYTFLKDEVNISIPPNPPIPPLEFKQFDDDFSNIEFGIDYILYSGGLRPAKLKISKLDVSASQESFNEKKNQITAEVKKTYLSVLQAEAVVKIYQKQMEAVKAHLERVKGFFEEGLVTKVDILQAKVKLSKVKRDLRSAQGKLKIAKSNLARLIGKNEEKISVEKVLINIPEELDLAELEKTALKKRNIIKYLNLQEKKLDKLTKIEKSSFYPKAFAQAKYTYSDQNPYIDPKGNVALTFGLGIKFRGIEPYHKILKIKAQQKKLYYQIEDLKSKIVLDVKNSYENFKTAKENLNVAMSALDEAQEYYTLVVEQFENQLATTTDVLNAEAALTQARYGKEISYYEYLKSFVDLERAVGENLTRRGEN
jgi:outer membrane protein TolC